MVRFTKKVDSAQNTRENTREKTEENLERDLVNSKKERSSEKFKTPRIYKENSGDEIFRILSHMSKQKKKLTVVMRNLKLRETTKKILAMKFLEYYLTCQNKEKKLMIVCRRELSCVCRKKKLING